MNGDLHCHTKLSDGSLGIEDLIILAKKRGITTIAITDHDCLAGTVRGKIIGERYGIQVIPGVELSATGFVEPLPFVMNLFLAIPRLTSASTMALARSTESFISPLSNPTAAV